MDSIDAARAEVARLRQLAKTNPAVHEAALGRALYELCRELNQSDRLVSTSYLDLLEEGIALHRRLLRRDSISLPQLAFMLGWLGVAQYRLGGITEARSPMEESIGLIRRMSHLQYELYETQLAKALTIACFILTEAGHPEVAISAVRESIAMLRQLAEEQPGEYDDLLLNSLHPLCTALGAADRREEMMATADEAVTMARRLHTRRSSGPRLLANALDLQVAAFAKSGEWSDALPVAEEAVRRYQEARRNGDRRPSLNYAGALTNLSKVWIQLGSESEAKAYVRYATLECYKRIRDTNPKELSQSASDIAGVLTSLGMTWHARKLLGRVNQRLTGQPGRLGKLKAWFRRS